MNLWCAARLSGRGIFTQLDVSCRSQYGNETLYRALRTPKGKQGDHDLRTRASTDPRPDESVAKADARTQLMILIYELKPLDRQIMLLYLEDLPQAEIAQTTGLSLANVSTKIHRLKESLTQRMRK